MAYETVNGLDADRTITIGGFNKKTKKDNPTEAEGYYLGSRVTTGGKYGDSVLHIIQDPQGNLGIWGKTDLTKKLKQVTPGCMILITYKGTKTTANGEMHTYEVKQDKTNTIDVSDLVDVPVTSDQEDGEGYSSGYNPADDDDEQEEVEAPPPRVAASGTPAERQARVQALLSKKAK